MRYLPLIVVLACPFALHAEAVTFSPGCLAKIYVIGNFLPDPDAGNSPPLAVVTEKQMKGLWPINTLPDGPMEVLRLPNIPIVAAPVASNVCYGLEEPNHLIESKTGILNNVNVYAVEFEGYFLASKEGLYTFGALSDDPFEIYVEGNKVAESSFAANMSEGPRSGNRPDDAVIDGDLKKDDSFPCSSNSAQGTTKLAPGRWYAVSILARQRWMAAYHNPIYIHDVGGRNARDVNRGACLTVTVSDPNGVSGPLKLSLPNVK